MLVTADHVILAYPELCAQFFGDLAAGIKSTSGRETTVAVTSGIYFFASRMNSLTASIGLDAELRLAYLVIQLGVLGVQADAYGVHETGKFGQDVPLMDEVGMAVRIDPHPAAPPLHFRGHGLDHIEPQQRLPVSAEHDLGIALRDRRSP